MTRPGQAVLIMAGGTGGHIFPGLAVADSLRQRGVEVRWLGARGGMECERVPAWDIPLDTVDISALRGKGAGRWLLLPWRLLRAVWQAFGHLGACRPACAVSFGGYAAGPGGLAARLRGIPLLPVIGFQPQWMLRSPQLRAEHKLPEMVNLVPSERFLSRPYRLAWQRELAYEWATYSSQF